MKIILMNMSIISLLACLIFASTGVGQPHGSQPTLILGTVDNFPPFSYIRNGTLTGIDIDVVNEAARRIGMAVTFKTYPWARVMATVKSGFLDGGFAAFKTAEREQFCLYTDILHFEEFYLFVRKGHEFPYSDIHDLYGKTIGIDRGVFVNEEFEQAVNEGKITVHEVDDMMMRNLKILSIGRIDAAIGDLGVMLYYAKSLGLDHTIIPLKPLGPKTGAYLVLSKASSLQNISDVQQKFQAALRDIKADGTYQYIFKQHTTNLP
jgi:ABC-type amino acid transport substrate-binding protein